MSKHDWHHLYNLAAWRTIRRAVLSEEPLCRRCGEAGRIALASVVHHTQPHKGDVSLFLSGPFEPLCKRCHDGDAQQVERIGYSTTIGVDGFPIDPNHPANR